jgi:radical SAM protein with 4Fe4S-binding SPASM domain
MKKILKQVLLSYGGYALAQDLNARIEHRRLTQKVYKYLKTGLAPIPDMIMFEPTQRCNLNCKMCYQDRNALKNQNELTIEQICTFFNQYPNLKKVALTGGEIFIRHDIVDLICYLDRTRDIVLSTNGTLIQKAEIERLEKCKRIFTTCISLDGPRDVHELIRGIKGSFDRTIRNIGILAQLFPVTVTCVIQNENIGVLPEVVHLCAALGVKKVKFELERIYSEHASIQAMDEMAIEAPDIPISSRGRMREYTLSTLQSKIRECKIHGKKAGICISFDPPFLINEIEACYSGNLRSKRKYVCQKFGEATMAPNGDLIHCFVIRKPFGNILDTSFEEIWNSEGANVFRRHLLMNNLTPLCENCPFMVPC